MLKKKKIILAKLRDIKTQKFKLLMSLSLILFVFLVEFAKTWITLPILIMTKENITQ